MSMFGETVLGNNRGVALLLAVTVVSLLIAVTVNFSKDMRQELMSSANALHAGTLRIMVKSGQNLAEAVLQSDGGENSFDTVHDSWSLLQESDVSQLYGIGELEVGVEDLSGRLQLNSLLGASDGGDDDVAESTREILKRILRSENLIDIREEQATLIIHAIIDYMDEDNNETGIEETESSYYRNQNPPSTSKNAPLEFIEELLRVRGITHDLYYGTTDYYGLRDFVTVHGDDGKININTAPKTVLQALATGINSEMVEDLIAFRENYDNNERLRNTDWYAGMLPGDVTFDSETVTTQSNYFRINVKAEYNQMTKSLHAVVQRKKDDNTIVLKSRKFE
uniref:type II secretion system minor pseudopilin GspK n=1 Tax=Candidatus Electrothrix sp. TaxID=2170559 RepID=UPI004056F777